MSFSPRRALFARTTCCSIFALMVALPVSALAADAAGAASSENLAPDAPQLETVVVTAVKGTAADVAPTKSSLSTTQPESTISRTFIENSVADTSDYTGTLVVSPSTSGVSNNGPGLSEKDATVRGFGDGEYNVTYDDIPFADTNDPSHHTTAYFPASTIGAVQVARGPGEAGDLGQASLGGTINLYSRTFSDVPYAQQKVTYGSWNTKNFVTTLQSGVLPSLGNSKVTANFQELFSDGALSYNTVEEYNQFLKIETPIGDNWTITFLGTHNKGEIHQPDHDGITLAQAATYGKDFSMTDNPALPTYYKYNITRKETDFEYVRADGKLGNGFSVQDSAYTYAYINHTYSVGDTTQSANDILNNTYGAWGTSPVSYGGPKNPTDVAGYDKLNAYRVWGNIARLNKDFMLGGMKGQARVGFWYEISETDRHRFQRDWTLGFVPNYIEKPPKCATATPPTCPMPDASVTFLERSSWDHYEPFLDVEFHPTDKLTITPGVKYVNLKRTVASPVGEKTRAPQYTSRTYERTLPFFNANYQIRNDWSVYAQYAHGFLIPPLKAFYVNDPQYDTIKPQTSINYQIGTVYNVNTFTFDADIYYVQAKNAFQKGSVPVPGGGFEKIYYNDGDVDYKGVEAEGTYAFSNGPLSGLAVFANGSYNQAEGVTKGKSSYHKQIKDAPKWTAAYGLVYARDGFNVSFVDKFTGEQWADDGEPAAYKIPAYGVANLVAGYDFGRFKLQGGVYNVFDDRSVTDIKVNDGPTPTDPNSHDQFWWVPERSFQITLRATLD